MSAGSPSFMCTGAMYGLRKLGPLQAVKVRHAVLAGLCKVQIAKSGCWWQSGRVRMIVVERQPNRHLIDCKQLLGNKRDFVGINRLVTSGRLAIRRLNIFGDESFW